MTRYNIALLSLLVSTAYAVPHYGQHGHKHPVHHKSGPQPSGVLPSGYGGIPTAGPTAPYGTANSTIVGSTGTAPVSSDSIITSVVTVVPQPEPTAIQESPVESSEDNSPIGGTSAAGGECGPATVTVTTADTITVTVPASSIESPIESTSAPYGNATASSSVESGTAPTHTSSVIPESSIPVIVNPTTSSSPDADKSPSVTHPSPLESSTSAVSPETATTSSVGAGEFYQTPTTPEEPTVEKLTKEEPTKEEPAKEAPTKEEPAKEEPAKEEPAKEEPAKEEPAKEEPAKEEPAKEEPAKEAPIKEEPTSTSKTPKTPSTDNVVPRGLVYNEASLTSAFSNANVGWMYNWDSAPGGSIDSSKEFVPMLWNTSQTFHVPHWNERAEAAIAAGTKHLLAFNEPDLPAQANMDVGQSVAGWMDYMEPFHTKHNGDVKLGSPSVCNGPEENMGLSYLKSFLDSCGGCHVDFIAIHWYGLATDDGVQHLKDHIGKAQEVAGGRAIWLTELKPDGSDEQQAAFLGKILPWLDDKSNGVDRYAYFKVDNMVNGASLTQAGSAYAA
ncbi:MAG: hypothetical protein L6R38_003710 [Xanthoria sp. 2 TBL-2021]|nr:MAG: hypothetical protein L6R38_003710 [Xanthoria sp. 2 TBL-2021]